MAADPAQRSDQTVADDPHGRGSIRDRRGLVSRGRGSLVSGGDSLGDSLGTARRHRVSAASLCAADGRAIAASLRAARAVGAAVAVSAGATHGLCAVSASAARGLCAGEAGGAECEHGSDEAVEQRREGGGAPSVAQVNVV